MSALINALLYAGLDRNEIEALLPEAREENRRYLSMYAGMTALIFAVCFLVSIVAGGQLVVNRPIYIAMIAVSFAAYSLNRWVAKRRKKMGTLIAVGYALSLYGYSFSVSLLHSQMQGAAAVAILLVMPTIFNYRPAYMVGLTVFAGAVYCALSARLKPYAIAMLDLWNVLFFGCIAVLLSVYQMKVKFRLLSQKRRNRQLSETDLLTGARNRNSFENSREAYAGACRESLTCVYIDANGLHELNDSQGHEAGDVMLQTVARAMIDRFGVMNTYRIGGDEFVAFCVDAPVEDVRDGIREIIREVSAAGYSVSVGASCHAREELDTGLLVKEAESYMYKEKRKYYEQGGHDRRRRVMGA